MAGMKDKEGRKGEDPERKVEENADGSSDYSSDDDPDEIVRKAQEKLEKAKRKAAKRAAAIELEKEKEKERLQKVAAQMLVATAAKTGEAGAGGGAGGAAGVSGVPKREHLSVLCVKFPADKSETSDGRVKYVSFPMIENPTVNHVKEFMKAETKGGRVEVTVIEKGKSYMVFDHRDNR
jgi:hypothetical protein